VHFVIKEKYYTKQRRKHREIHAILWEKNENWEAYLKNEVSILGA
jgi:hypothetical protein